MFDPGSAMPVRDTAWSTSDVGDLSRIWPGVRFQSPPGPFAADVVQMRLGDVIVESLLVSPHSGAIDEGAARIDGRRAVSIAIVTSGTMWHAGPSGRYVQSEGEVAFTWTDEPFSFGWRGHGSLIRAVVCLDAARSRAVSAAGLPSGPLPDHPRVQSYIAFMASIVDSAREQPEAGVEFERAVWWLQLALMKTTQHHSMTSSPSAVRARIHEYIEAHLFDQDLSATAVARALNVSVRTVHNAFSNRGSTAARSIRQARVEAVASALRREDSQCRHTNAALADEFGFPSVDAMQRAFTEEFGVRVHGYRRSLTDFEGEDRTTQK